MQAVRRHCRACYTSCELIDAGQNRKRTKCSPQMTPESGDVQTDQCSIDTTQAVVQPETGEGSCAQADNDSMSQPVQLTV